MPRVVSFRFDDGFIAGARTAAKCLSPDHGTFFLIADLVSHGPSAHSEPLFQWRDFGSVRKWRALAEDGQDIQLHGRTHTNMLTLSDEERCEEVVASLNLTRRIHCGPYVFCHPFNSLVDIDFAALGISAAGFETRTSDQPITFHRLADPVDLFALSSWAVRERHFDAVVEQLASLPDESWTILAFHSFGDEGHEPWSVAAFQKLVSSCRNLDLRIVTVADMVRRLGGATDSVRSDATSLFG